MANQLIALSVRMDISNSDIGLILLLYQAVSSVTQPFFGRLSERIGGRPLAVGAILWTTLMFSLSLFAQTKVLIALPIALAGFGSGAWHPQGAANSTISGGTRWAATATSLFFLGGNLGTSFLGSALGGYLLDAYGRRALLLLSVITVFLALAVVRRMVPRWVEVPERKTSLQGQAQTRSNGRVFWAVLVALLVGIALRSLCQHSLNTYIPKYQQDLGVSPATYGFVMSLFVFGMAIGGVAGSYLADHVGLRQVLAGSMVLAALTWFVFVRTTGLWSYAALASTGLFIGPSHNLFVVSGQRRFPQRMAMISGAFMGFTFISGAGGSWVVGLLADRVGLGTMLGLLPWALLIAAACALVGVPEASPRLVAEESDSAAA